MTRALLALLLVLALPALASATSPAVDARQTSATSADTTSHPVTLPACASGKLLIVGVSIRNTSTVVTWPGGWNALVTAVTNGSATGSSHVHVRYKTSTGSDTLTITTDAGRASAHTSYCISGQHASSAPEAAAGTGATTLNPNPPSITPSWGAEDNLYLAFVGNTGSNTASGYPASYVNGQTVAATVSASLTAMSSAERATNTSPEDPGTFTLTGSQNTLPATIAVRPATSCVPRVGRLGAGGC